MNYFEQACSVGQVTGIIIFAILFIYCTYKLFRYLSNVLPRNMRPRFPPALTGVILWLGGGILSTNVLKPWLNTLTKDVGFIRIIGLIVFILARLICIFGFGLIVYSFIQYLIRFFRKLNP